MEAVPVRGLNLEEEALKRAELLCWARQNEPRVQVVQTEKRIHLAI